MIQFNFVKDHIPGTQKTAADYLSRLEADPKDKLVMKIREDVQTLPIEINVQSSRVSQEEQILYTMMRMREKNATNLERIARKDEILTRHYFDETGNVKYHQILLPQHLLQELLQFLPGTAHKHPGISKMLQEIRQR